MTERPDDPDRTALTRRSLLTRAGAAAAAIGVGGIAGACASDAGSGVGPASIAPDTDASGMPFMPGMQVPMAGVLGFFTKDEARAVDALASRFLPGSAEDPGARELGVVTFIDHKLASFHSFATPTYFKPPFAVGTSGHPGPQPNAGATIGVNDEELPRYGFQSNLTPQQAYRKGLAALQAYTNGTHGKAFADLGEPLQDTIIGLLEIGKIDTFDSPTAEGFFSMLQEDVNEGAFADPMYGGNRGLAGWKLIGYPGAQRAYTERELKHGPLHKRTQGLREMMAQSPGVQAPHVFLPISGSGDTSGVS
jgi:gluconate 2-dehydrogenase gamma chain